MKRIILIIICTFISNPIVAADLTDVETGADFLKFGVGGRASAMGEAYVAAAEDITAVYWNPAGLANIKNVVISGMHSDTGFEDTSFEFVAFAYPHKFLGVIAIHAAFLLYKPIPVTVSSEETAGELTWQDWSIGLSYGKSILEGLEMGLGIKFIQKLESDPIFGTLEGSVYAADLGLIYHTYFDENLSLGCSIVNMGKKIRIEGEKISDHLPRTFRVGASYKLEQFVFTSDISRVLDRELEFGIGTEYLVSDRLFLRLGYFDKAGGIAGLSYGVGIKFNNVSIDWATLPVGEMLETERESRISMTFNF